MAKGLYFGLFRGRWHGLGRLPPPCPRISHRTRRHTTASASFSEIFGLDECHRPPPSLRHPIPRPYTIVPPGEPVEGDAKTVANKSPSVTSRKSSANCTLGTGAGQLIGGWSTASNFEKLFLSIFSYFFVGSWSERTIEYGRRRWKASGGWLKYLVFGQSKQKACPQAR